VPDGQLHVVVVERRGRLGSPVATSPVLAGGFAQPTACLWALNRLI